MSNIFLPPKLFVLIFALIYGGCASFFGFDQTPSTRARLKIPTRKPNAVTGSEFLKQTQSVDPKERDDRILREILSGNIPDYLRNQVNIRIVGQAGGVTHTMILTLLPDYLGIGNNQDFVRIPMTPMAAEKIAREFGAVLPTRKMVNLIYQYAGTKLKPRPLPPTSEMVSNAYYRRHQAIIQEQLNGSLPRNLVAGHKKDVVTTPLLKFKPMRVAIYGWHQDIGRPIQPLSLVHGASYADYSHGVRLIANAALLNGKIVPIADILNDRKLSDLLSDEGILDKPTAYRGVLSENFKQFKNQTIERLTADNL